MQRKNIVTIQKGEHIYCFRYFPGDEKNLFLAMIEYGRDARFNISITEALHLIRKISAYMRECGIDIPSTFVIKQDNS